MVIASKKHSADLAIVMVLSLLIAPFLNLFNALPTYAYDEEACMEYDEGIVCVGLDISNSDRDYEFNVRVGNYEGNNLPQLRCQIRHSSSSSLLWESCNDTIRWSGSNGQFLLTATLDGEDGTFIYDVDDRDWDLQFREINPRDVDDFYGNNGGSNDDTSNSSDVEDIRISTSTSQHVEDQRIDATISLLDDDSDVATRATGRVNFIVEKNQSNGWFQASSNDYSLSMSSYNFTSSDDGERFFDNLVMIKVEGEYRLRVEWNNDNGIYDTESFNIGTTSSYTDYATQFYVDVSDDNPEEDDYIDLTIQAERNDGTRATNYRNSIRFKVYYLNGNTWSQTTSSSYYTLRDNDYRFEQNDNGRVNLNNWIRFNREETYKIEVSDIYDSSIDGSVVVEVGDGNGGQGGAYEIDVSVDDRTPGVNQWLDLTLEILDRNGDVVEDFSDTVKVTVYYRDGNGWRATTSSIYINLGDDDLIRFRSSDDGEITLNDFIRFKRDQEYRIEAKVVNDISVDGSIDLDVGASSSNNNNDLDSIKITSSDKNPDLNQWTDVTFEMLDEDGDRYEDFDGKLLFTVYWNDDGTWRTTTSPSHFEIKSSYQNGYTFSTTSNGRINLTNFIRFKLRESFRLEARVSGQSTIKGLIVYAVGGSNAAPDTYTSSQADLLSAEILTKDINVNDKVDVRVKAITDEGSISNSYRDKVVFITKKLSSLSSRTWATPSNGDYSLFVNSYTFTSSDSGNKNLYDLWSPKRNGYYRLTVEQDDDNDMFGWSYIFVTDNVVYASTIPGFSSTQRTNIRSYYKAWPSAINSILKAYPELVGDSDWEDLWLDFYERMEKTVKGSSGKYTSYTSFKNALQDFVSETVNDYLN